MANSKKCCRAYSPRGNTPNQAWRLAVAKLPYGGQDYGQLSRGVRKKYYSLHCRMIYNDLSVQACFCRIRLRGFDFFVFSSAP